MNFLSYIEQNKDILIEVLKAAIIAIAEILIYIVCTRGKAKKEKKA